jgi:hypothetical protein
MLLRREGRTFRYVDPQPGPDEFRFHFHGKPHINREWNMLVPLFGTTPKGLTTQGFSLCGNIVTAFSVTISTTAFVTSWRCSSDEEEFSISFLM